MSGPGSGSSGVIPARAAARRWLLLWGPVTPAGRVPGRRLTMGSSGGLLPGGDLDWGLGGSGGWVRACTLPPGGRYFPQSRRFTLTFPGSLGGGSFLLTPPWPGVLPVFSGSRCRCPVLVGFLSWSSSGGVSWSSSGSLMGVWACACASSCAQSLSFLWVVNLHAPPHL